MSIIRPSADLRNNYNEISELCHREGKPVFITKNGTGDLVVMSMEVYDEMKKELYSFIEEGLRDVEEGRVRPWSELKKGIEKELLDEGILFK